MKRLVTLIHGNGATHKRYHAHTVLPAGERGQDGSKIDSKIASAFRVSRATVTPVRQWRLLERLPQAF